MVQNERGPLELFIFNRYSIGWFVFVFLISFMGVSCNEITLKHHDLF